VKKRIFVGKRDGTSHLNNNKMGIEAFVFLH